MKWDDLLSVPYKANGRGADGMDCYGLAVECCRRAGTPLRDIAYPGGGVPVENGYYGQVNVEAADGPAAGRLVQCERGGLLHVGFMVDGRRALHMTYEGARVTPVAALGKTKFYRVVRE